MGKISDYTRVLAAKLADVFVVDQTDNGTTETKSATVEQIGTAIGTLQNFADLDTSNTTLVDSINEVNGAITKTTLTTKTHCKYMELPNRIVFIVVDGATNNEELDIPAPSSTQYFAGLSQSNTYAAFSISAGKKVTIITSGVTQVYGNFVYFKAV